MYKWFVSSVSDSTLSLLMYLTYSLFFFFGGYAIFRYVQSCIEQSQEDKLAPVKFNTWQSILRSLNPARWGGRCRCVAGQAHVRQAYPVLRRGMGKFLIKFSVPGGTFGIPHPFRPHQVHYDVIWYQYEVNGLTLWGKFQFPFGFDTPEQAWAIAQAMIGKAIPIRYDPDVPENSEPVFPSIMRMLDL
jgi:hypothetical protein